MLLLQPHKIGLEEIVFSAHVFDVLEVSLELLRKFLDSEEFLALLSGLQSPLLLLHKLYLNYDAIRSLEIGVCGSIILFMSGFLGNVGGAVLWKSHSQISQQLITVHRLVSDQSFSQMKHSLEFSVVGVVVFVSHCDQVQVAAALIYMLMELLSTPKSSVRAFFSAHQAATRESPTTPPM